MEDLGTVLEHPVIKPEDLPEDFDADDAKLREAAQLADSGQDIPADLLGKPEAQTPEKTTDTPTERPRDALGRFTKTEAGDDIPESERKPAEDKAVADAAAKTDPPVLSEFEQKKQEKAAKEKERQDRSWENLNRQKEELEQRRRELAEIEQRTRQPQQQKQPVQQRQFSSQDLLDAHEEFKAKAKKALDDGDYDTFNEQNALAEQAFANAGQFYQVEQEEAQQIAMDRHNQTWVANMEAAIKENPDLVKPDSPIAIQMLDLLKTHGAIFQMIPDGFKQAEVIAKLRLDAAEAPTLRERVKALEAAKAEQDKLLAPTPGGVTSAPSSKGKTLEDMSEAEADAFLRRAAEQHDANLVP